MHKWLWHIRIPVGIAVLCASAALWILPLSGCVNNQPHLFAAVTPPPTAAPTPTSEPTASPVPTDMPEPSPSTEAGDTADALGNLIIGTDHYTRYLSFIDIQVYEENGDTFVDCKVVNEYPVAICCAVDIVFYEEDGVEVARAQLQTRDGMYLLVMNPGETVLFAHVMTDMTLLDFSFALEFDTEAGVRPQA